MSTPLSLLGPKSPCAAIPALLRGRLHLVQFKYPFALRQKDRGVKGSRIYTPTPQSSTWPEPSHLLTRPSTPCSTRASLHILTERWRAGEVKGVGEYIRLHHSPSTRPKPSHPASALCLTYTPLRTCRNNINPLRSAISGLAFAPL
jgi:hypothetical protein